MSGKPRLRSDLIYMLSGMLNPTHSLLKSGFIFLFYFASEPLFVPCIVYSTGGSIVCYSHRDLRNAWTMLSVYCAIMQSCRHQRQSCASARRHCQHDCCDCLPVLSHRRKCRDTGSDRRRRHHSAVLLTVGSRLWAEIYPSLMLATRDALIRHWPIVGRPIIGA